MNFTPQLILEHFGVFVAAITGVLAARGKRLDLFGVLVLALVTAFGGGTVRDLLVGDGPVAWLRGPGFLLNAILAVLLTFFVNRMRSIPPGALAVADAFALALFTIIGTTKGVSLEFSAPVSVLLGVVTGVAGSILRDVLTGSIPALFQPHTHLYATAAMGGAALFTTLHALGYGGAAVTVTCTAVIVVLRLAAIRWRLTLPVYDPS